MNEFKIGQTFDGSYPPMAAVWCNMNEADLVFNEEENKFKIVSRDPEKNRIAEEEKAKLAEALTKKTTKKKKSTKTKKTSE